MWGLTFKAESLARCGLAGKQNRASGALAKRVLRFENPAIRGGVKSVHTPCTIRAPPKRLLEFCKKRAECEASVRWRGKTLGNMFGGGAKGMFEAKATDAAFRPNDCFAQGAGFAKFWLCAKVAIAQQCSEGLV
jgi:hypothetical protein